MSAQPPAGHDELPPPGSIRCPRCSATLGPDQDWCLECGAPARTRLAPTPNWQLPTAAIGAMVLVAGALLAFAFVELTGDDGTPAGTTPTAVVQTAPPPVVVAPPAVTATTPTPLPTATTTAPAGPAAPATTVPGQPATPPEVTTSTAPARTTTSTTPGRTTDAPDARDP